MMKKYFCAFLMGAIVLLTGVSCSDNTTSGISEGTDAQVTVNVDVIAPADMQSKWNNAIQLAQTNIAQAQQNIGKKVKINVRMHDEDKENIDALAKQLVNPTDGDTCSVIIGPYVENNAKRLLGYVIGKNISVMLPTCSDSELQRIYSRTKNVWFLTESVATECELALHCMKQLDKNSEYVGLVYSNDSVGRSFHDYFGFYATELKLDVLPNGVAKYKANNKTELNDLLKSLKSDEKAKNMNSVCLALSADKENMEVLDSLNKYQQWCEHLPFVCFTGANDDLMNLIQTPVYGVSPFCSSESGFMSAYNAKYKSYPVDGEAQVYDAISIIALGAAKRLGTKDPTSLYINDEKAEIVSSQGTPSLNDWMRAVVSSESGDKTDWMATGLNKAFKSFSLGESCIVTGATGDLKFDKITSTKILYTTYGWWYLDKGKEPSLIAFLSTEDQGATVGTNTIFQWEISNTQEFEQGVYVNHNLPECTDNWALLITPSTQWANYRHQADVFYMYQLLISRGFSADHIVTVSEDNLANRKENAGYAGKIFIEKGGADVRSGCKVDYHFSDLTRDDIGNILLGNKSDKLTKVFNTTASSNIFMFWSGHGGSSDGPLWGDEDGRAFGSEKMRAILDKMQQEKKFRRIFMAIETCHSGIWGEAMQGLKDVLVITSANPYESSFADAYDADRGIYYCNAFAKTFHDVLSESKSSAVMIRDLYLNLAKTTKQSHVRLYNESNYGSVYSNAVNEYFPN